jgi:hypothetical protein
MTLLIPSILGNVLRLIFCIDPYAVFCIMPNTRYSAAIPKFLFILMILQQFQVLVLWLDAVKSVDAAFQLVMRQVSWLDSKLFRRGFYLLAFVMCVIAIVQSLTLYGGVYTPGVSGGVIVCILGLIGCISISVTQKTVHVLRVGMAKAENERAKSVVGAISSNNKGTAGGEKGSGSKSMEKEEEGSKAKEVSTSKDSTSPKGKGPHVSGGGGDAYRCWKDPDTHEIHLARGNV